MFIMLSQRYIIVKDGILQTSEVNSCLPFEVSHMIEGVFSGLGDVLRCAGLLWVKREHPYSVVFSRCLTYNSIMGKIRYKPII